MTDFINSLLESSNQPQLFFLGQAGFIIKSSSGQLLGVDMYLSDCVERVEGHIGFKRLLPKILNPQDIQFDYIVATHPHVDHFDIDAIPLLMANSKTKLYASIECDKLVKDLKIDENIVTYVKPSDEVYCGDFKINFIKCDHGLGAPDAVGVVITVDNKKIIMLGDTCLHMDWIDYYNSFGSFDIMIAPINGAYGNLDDIDCIKLANEIHTKLLIPCHFGMFASHGGNPQRFVESMKTNKKINKYFLMTQGEYIAI